jgi:transposase-like protein
VEDIMGKQRQTWSADQKQAVVLAALRGDHSIAALARQHGIREQLIYRWKADFLEAGARALGGSKAHQADETLQKENDPLKTLLGEKTLELDILKKWSSL